MSTQTIETQQHEVVSNATDLNQLLAGGPLPLWDVIAVDKHFAFEKFNSEPYDSEQVTMMLEQLGSDVAFVIVRPANSASTAEPSC